MCCVFSSLRLKAHQLHGTNAPLVHLVDKVIVVAKSCARSPEPETAKVAEVLGIASACHGTIAQSIVRLPRNTVCCSYLVLEEVYFLFVGQDVLVCKYTVVVAV